MNLPLAWLKIMQEISRVFVWDPGLGNESVGSRNRSDKECEEVFAVAE